MTKPSSHKGLYILLISVHGLIRGRDLELGRDADTGGQTKYVLELAKALSKQHAVEKIVLATRLVDDPRVSADYAIPIEELAPNLQIIRIRAGGNEYIAKEMLWPCIDNFADNLYSWLSTQPRLPDVIHSHYADAGYVGVRLANLTGLPLIHTGHSLGRDKYSHLVAIGMGTEKIEERYRMQARISAEEDTLCCAELVITSTRNEIESQYELYDFYTPEKMAVIPPGTDLEKFHPPTTINSCLESQFKQKLDSFLQNPAKPMILALSRPDERKNIVSLLEAFGRNKKLRKLANLVIVAGNRDDIRELHEGAQAVLTELLLLVDSYELYGQVALPKHHSAEEVPEIYRLAYSSKGVFVNPALTEPFGLTLLEATASGLPLVATENGGPVDIIGNCHNGLLVDPLSRGDIAFALLSILEKPKRWQTFSSNGLQNIKKYYSWEAHAKTYLDKLQDLTLKRKPLAQVQSSHQFSSYRNQALFTAIDNTLLGDEEALVQLIEVVRANRRRFLFGIATGRRLDAVLTILKRNSIPAPDVLVTSLGTEIYYSSKLFPDIAWSNHIDHAWTPQVLRRCLKSMPGLTPQPKAEQSRFKVSYFYDAQIAPSLEELLGLLRQQELSVNATLSFGQYLDIVPARASKGQALRYVASKYNIPLDRTLVTGGSGGDADMLRGNTLGVVVANRHSEELLDLTGNEQVYFAKGAHAWGVIEAIRHYGFF